MNPACAQSQIRPTLGAQGRGQRRATLRRNGKRAPPVVAHRHTIQPSHAEPSSHFAEAQIHARLTNPAKPNIITSIRGSRRPVADFKSEPRPASNRNQWPASYWNAWPASSVSAPTGSFRRYSALKVLHGDVDAASLRGQVVVVGMTAAGLGDTFATPFDRVAPGVDIFATAISNLLSGDTLARTPSTRRIGAVMAAGLPVAMIALIAMRRAAVGLALAALVFLFWAGGVFLAFVNGYWLSMALPLATSVPVIAGYTGAPPPPPLSPSTPSALLPSL